MLMDMGTLAGAVGAVAPLVVVAWWKLRLPERQILLDHEREAVAEVWDQAQYAGLSPWDIHMELLERRDSWARKVATTPLPGSGPDFHALGVESLASSYGVDTGQITAALDGISASDAW